MTVKQGGKLLILLSQLRQRIRPLYVLAASEFFNSTQYLIVLWPHQSPHLLVLVCILSLSLPVSVHNIIGGFPLIIIPVLLFFSYCLFSWLPWVLVMNLDTPFHMSSTEKDSSVGDFFNHFYVIFTSLEILAS